MLMQLAASARSYGRGTTTTLSWPMDQHAPRLRRLTPNSVLFHEGAPAVLAFELVSGMLKLVRVTTDGRELILDFPGPGDIVGLADSEGYPYTAHVVDRTEVRVVSRDSLLRAVAATNNGERLLSLTCRSARASYDHVQMLALRPPSRIATFLLRMAARQANHPGHARLVALPMSRRDIAGHLAVAPETLCRLIRRLRESAIINVIGADLVEILDAGTLAELANGSLSGDRL